MFETVFRVSSFLVSCLMGVASVANTARYVVTDYDCFCFQSPEEGQLRRPRYHSAEALLHKVGNKIK